MSTIDCIKAFSNGATKGKAFNMFIEGDVLFDYGYHFPIAIRMLSGGFLVNKTKYSRTTSKHQNYVRRILGDKIETEVETDTMKKMY